jgi:starch-binding outer membrane protein, SusD/RagB family
MKRLSKYILACALLASLGACEKKITDLQPIDQIPAQNAIQTMSDVTSALNGVYGTWLGRRASYLSSFISDETRLGTGTEYRNVGNILFNWQHVSDSQDWRDTENGGCWTNLYQVIDRANRVLELMAPVVTNNATEASLKTQIRGELLALRAMAHFELLRWYAATPEYSASATGVVLQTEYVKAPGSYRPSRNSQQDIINQVTADLTEAKTLIPAGFSDISRVTRNAISGAQARVALHTKNWQAVVDRSTEVITAQPLTPIGSYAALWTTRTLTSNQSTEVVWKLNVSPANLGAGIGSLWQDVGTGAVQASPAVKLMNTFAPTDIRFTTFFRTSPRNLIAKYGVVITSPANGENFQYDIKMMRTSEMVLSRAEAYAELNQLTPANNDLSAIRTARIPGYVHVAINDKALLLAAIMEERYKELCYEGHRYFDLRRRSLPINRDLADAGGNTASQNLLTTDSKYLLPIPQQEIFANPNCGQNPGY